MRPKIIELNFEILKSMFSIHALEYFIRSRLQSKVQVVTHLREFKMCREDVRSHIMRIAGSETYTIESIYYTDSF